MTVTAREVILYWLPLVSAAIYVLLHPDIGRFLPVFGMVSRPLFQMVRESLVLEVERLRLLGLRAHVAVEYTAEKVDCDPEALNVAHFHWLLDRYDAGDGDPVRFVHKV